MVCLSGKLVLGDRLTLLEVAPPSTQRAASPVGITMPLAPKGKKRNAPNDGSVDNDDETTAKKVRVADGNVLQVHGSATSVAGGARRKKIAARG
jgi:hypothetical protein